MINMHRVAKVLVLSALAAAAVSCGDVVRQGRSPSMLVIELLTDAAGSGTLQSDVVDTSTAPCSPTSPCPAASDFGAVKFSLVMKDVSITKPTSNNYVTINRYHVEYTRADGRNRPGVDVPYPFDGAMTGTVKDEATLSFELVRQVAKAESPLVQLATNRQIISPIANVTFYGRDTVGNEVSVTGSILIEFANFQDKKQS
jgi:hypothetical protein